MVGTEKNEEMEQKTYTSEKSSKESGHSVIYERLEEKKAKESKQTSQEEFKDVKAAAERLSASQKKKTKEEEEESLQGPFSYGTVDFVSRRLNCWGDRKPPINSTLEC